MAARQASAALAAAALGKRVALVEKSGSLGGAGINTGTIPSKTLRETALVLAGWKSRRLHGVDLSLKEDTTIENFQWHARNVMNTERARNIANLDLHAVKRFQGLASFLDPHNVRIVSGDGEMLLRGEKILVATGSSPLRPSDFAFEDDRIHDSDEILALTKMPSKLVVVGAGVIGSEYASTFAALGVEVHLVDGRDKLMPFLDEEIADTLTAAMAAQGVKFHWRQRVSACDLSHPGEVRLILSTGAILSCDGLLVCAGRQSNTDALDLKAAGITAGERGLILVDGRYQTSVPHIYAAGDVIGAPALAATGIEQARNAVAHAFNPSHRPRQTLLPTGVYTIPEVGFAGKTEEELRRDGVKYVAGRSYYSDHPRGNIIGERDGMLKLIFRESDMRLLGIHVVGEQATELLHIGLIGLLAGADAELLESACSTIRPWATSTSTRRSTPWRRNDRWGGRLERLANIESKRHFDYGEA